MTRTLNQKMADRHEAAMADWISGRLTKASGNQWHNPMDVRNGSRTVSFPMAGDGKATCRRSVGVSREMWEKAVTQAGPELEPFLGLRFYEDETLEKVGHDLVVVSADAFVRLLEAARRWQDHEDAEDQGMAEFEEGVVAYELSLDKESHIGGCDCCR